MYLPMIILYILLVFHNLKNINFNKNSNVFKCSYIILLNLNSLNIILLNHENLIIYLRISGVTYILVLRIGILI